MMEVEYGHLEALNAPAVLAAILNECGAVTDYRTLRDTLPRRLAGLLKCRCVLIYQRIGETLHFASGTFDDKPGWSPALLSVAHINPMDLKGDTPEAVAWRSRSPTTAPARSATPSLVAVPLLYRQRAIGVLVAIRMEGDLPSTGPLVLSAEQKENPLTSTVGEKSPLKSCWVESDVQVLEAVGGVVALLLENTRLLERDRERIHELSLLNSISSQMNCSMYEWERIQSIIIQRTREITSADLCTCVNTAPSSGQGIEDEAPADASSSATPVSWLSSALRVRLLDHFHMQRENNPLVIERPGDPRTGELLTLLAPNIKTFFALPLLGSRGGGRAGITHAGQAPLGGVTQQKPQVLGIIVGAYHRPWKLRREELVLLQVLASQATAVLENMQLMAEVVEARNQARTLLRQVLDDQRLKALILESIPSGLITINLAGNITIFNRAAQDILGYHPYEVQGKPLQQVLNMDTLLAGIRRSETDAEVRSEAGLPLISVPSETLTTVNRQGQEIVLEVAIVPLRDDRGEQIGALATFTDVTSMHRLEEEKRRLDRLASLGEMAASVAHEVRNPLASIKISVQMLMDDLAGFAGNAAGSSWDIEETKESVSIVLKEVERLDSIVRDLLLFARPRQLHRVPCNLVELSEQVLHVMQWQCAEAGVEVHRVYHPVPTIQVDIAQIEQVLFNLYMNAVQAMTDGGVLTVACQVIPVTQASHHPANTASSGSAVLGSYHGQHAWLELSVSDTGNGIAPELVERIFQPFFTTKAHGIGLGLPITRRLIEDHHGCLLVESQLGYGATFSVRLPLNEGREEATSVETVHVKRGGMEE